MQKATHNWQPWQYALAAMACHPEVGSKDELVRVATMVGVSESAARSAGKRWIKKLGSTEAAEIEYDKVLYSFGEDFKAKTLIVALTTLHLSPEQVNEVFASYKKASEASETPPKPRQKKNHQKPARKSRRQIAEYRSQIGAQEGAPVENEDGILEMPSVDWAAARSEDLADYGWLRLGTVACRECSAPVPVTLRRLVKAGADVQRYNASNPEKANREIRSLWRCGDCFEQSKSRDQQRRRAQALEKAAFAAQLTADAQRKKEADAAWAEKAAQGQELRAERDAAMAAEAEHLAKVEALIAAGKASEALELLKGGHGAESTATT